MDGFDPDRLDIRSGHFVAGRLVDGGPGGRLEVRRPSDGRTYAELPAATADDVDAAVEDAGRAFRTSG